MGKVVYWIVVLAIAGGAARLGLGLSPLELSQYETWEAAVIAALVAVPVLIVGVLVARLVWSRSRLLVSAFHDLPMKIRGTDATGTIAGVPMSVTLGFVEDHDGKRSLRWLLAAREIVHTTSALLVLRSKKRTPLVADGVSEVEVPGAAGADHRAWVRPTKGTPFRGAPRLPDVADEAWLARLQPADADEVRLGESASTVMVAPNTTPEAIRGALVLARATVEPRSDALPALDVPLPRKSRGAAGSAIALGAAIATFTVYIFFSPCNKGFEVDTLALLESCPGALAPLGGSFERKMFGFQSSTTKGKESRGNKWWLEDILVRGAKAEGRIDTVATRIDRNNWLLLKAELAAGGKRFDLIRCGQVAGNVSRDRTLTMKVVEVSGAAPTTAGATCKIASKIGSNDFNCRIEIGCKAEGSPATVMLYGATERLGFTLCGPIVGEKGVAGLVADDTDRRVTHEEPLLWLNEPGGFAELESPDRVWKVRLEGR